MEGARLDCYGSYADNVSDARWKGLSVTARDHMQTVSELHDMDQASRYTNTVHSGYSVHKPVGTAVD